MQNFVALAIIVVAVVFAALAGRAAWMRSRPVVRSAAAASGELVAVIAAAVAAASGLEPGSFRIVGIQGPRQPDAGSRFMRGGLNTPAWGHVDRFIQGD